MFLKHVIEAIEANEVVEIEYLEYYKEYVFTYFDTNELFCIDLGGGETLVSFSELSIKELVESYYSLKDCRAEEYRETKEIVMNALLNVKCL